MIDQPQPIAMPINFDGYRVDAARVAEAMMSKLDLLKAGREAIAFSDAEAGRIHQPSEAPQPRA